MVLAGNKYKLLVEQGLWDAPSAEEEKIIALRAEVQELKKSQTDTPSNAPTEEQPKGATTKARKKKQPKPKPAWFTVEPSANKLKVPRQWNNREWWWCSPKTGGKCDGVYRIHKPCDCQGTGGKFVPKRKEPDTSNGDANNNNTRLRVQSALQQAADDQDSFSDANEE